MSTSPLHAGLLIHIVLSKMLGLIHQLTMILNRFFNLMLKDLTLTLEACKKIKYNPELGEKVLKKYLILSKQVKET